MTRAPVIPFRPDPLPTRESPAKTPGVAGKPARLASLDAYRGLIMVMLVSGAFGLHRVAFNEALADDPTWQAVKFQTDHVAWDGGTIFHLLRQDPASLEANRKGNWFGGGVWDLIQPSFMFMAGVAIPYSFAARRARGDSLLRIWLHVFLRSFLLIALGIFLRSTGSRTTQTNFTFEDVITQIGLGYPIVFLVFGIGEWLQSRPLVYVTALIAILGGYWTYFYIWPLPPEGFDFSQVGLEGPWPRAEGLFAHWNKNTNAAQWFDVWFLNLFPRKSPWQFNGGGYLTLNFVPSMATAIFGIMAGSLLRTSRGKGVKLLALLLLSAGCLALGAYANETVCPIVKRIWTPSWAIYSAGWTFFLLAASYAIFDCTGLRWLAFPLAVVGMNSIAVYCMEDLIRDWIAAMLRIHLDVPVHYLIDWLNKGRSASQQLTMESHWYSVAGIYGPILEMCAVMLVIWLICLWMYRRKIFIRL